MRKQGHTGLARAGLTLSLLCVLAAPVAAQVRISDVPLLDRSPSLRKVTIAPTQRGGCRNCSLFEGPHEVRQLSVKSATTPFLLVFNLVLRLDDYFYARGRAPSKLAGPASMRLSLVAPESPLSFVNREPQDLESLSLYVLELRELGLVASARQQSHGGLWGQLSVGDLLHGEVSGLLTRGGPHTTGPYWFGTHKLDVRTPKRQVRAEGAPAMFAFLSLQNDLTRDLTSFQDLSVLPGAGLGLFWRIRRDVTFTLTTSANVGGSFDLASGAASPRYSIGLQQLAIGF